MSSTSNCSYFRSINICVNLSGSVSGSGPSGSRSGGIFGVFNLPSAESSIVCRNCATVGALYGYNKNALENNRQNLSRSDAEAEAAKVFS